MFRKKKRDDDDPFDGFFEEFSRIDEIMEELMKNMFSNKGRIEMGKPYVYGFSMKSGPNGKPVINEFGNVKLGDRPTVSNEREPLVDVTETEKEVIITAELPGVSKGDIDLDVAEDSLEISVDTEKKGYHKVVSLPDKVKTDDVNASYNNGILEVKLKKEKASKKEGKKVKIK